VSPQLPYTGPSGEPEWEAADGRRIPVSKLSLSHLKNIIALLERRIRELDDEDDSDWTLERIIEAEEWLDILAEELERRAARGFTWERS